MGKMSVITHAATVWPQVSAHLAGLLGYPHTTWTQPSRFEARLIGAHLSPRRHLRAMLRDRGAEGTACFLAGGPAQQPFPPPQTVSPSQAIPSSTLGSPGPDLNVDKAGGGKWG